MRTIVFFICFAVFTLFNCEKNDELQQPGKKINVTKTTSEIIATDNAFGLELFPSLAESLYHEFLDKPDPYVPADLFPLPAQAEIKLFPPLINLDVGIIAFETP